MVSNNNLILSYFVSTFLMQLNEKHLNSWDNATHNVNMCISLTGYLRLHEFTMAQHTFTNKVTKAKRNRKIQNGNKIIKRLLSDN